jgi:hypothetical protein
MLKWVRRISFAFLIVVVLAVLAGFTYEQVERSGALRVKPRFNPFPRLGGLHHRYAGAA